MTVQWLPITWHTVVQKEEAVQSQMGDITLPSVPAMREFVNKALTDVLFFLTPLWRDKIISHVSASLTKRYRQFCARNPGFAETGRVSIAAHSLGTVITWEVLRQQPSHAPIPNAVHAAPTASAADPTARHTAAPSAAASGISENGSVVSSDDGRAAAAAPSSSRTRPTRRSPARPAPPAT